MRFLFGAIAGLLGIAVVFRWFRPFAGPTRPEDAGTVSEDWRAEQRRLSDEH